MLDEVRLHELNEDGETSASQEHLKRFVGGNDSLNKVSAVQSCQNWLPTGAREHHHRDNTHDTQIHQNFLTFDDLVRYSNHPYVSYLCNQSENSIHYSSVRAAAQQCDERQQPMVCDQVVPHLRVSVEDIHLF